MQILAPSIIKKSVQLLTVTALFTTSSLYAASMTIKVKNNIQWSEEAAFFGTNKGNISIYAVDLTPKQYQNLKSIKKGDCIQITAKDQKFENYEGITTIMEFQNAKKVTCK
jgi:guanyl-specific ribonuclease Sa